MADSTPVINDVEDAFQPAGAPAASEPPASVETLPSATVDFANKMFDLARNGSLELLEYVSAGLPSNLSNARGDTLLMLASYHGHVSLVRGLLTASTSLPHQPGRPAPTDADPNQLNGKGQSMLAGAVFKTYPDVVHVLLEHGADPLAGTPNAEDTARMFGAWTAAPKLPQGDDAEPKAIAPEGGWKEVFENAKGRGRGGVKAKPGQGDDDGPPMPLPPMPAQEETSPHGAPHLTAGR